MTEKRIQDIVAQAIAESTLSREKYYHVCWWDEKIQCLPARHTKEGHDAFYSAPGQAFIEGLSSYQWDLVTERVADFCRRRRLRLEDPSEQVNDECGHDASGRKRQITEFDSKRLRALLASTKAPTGAANPYLDKLLHLLETADTVRPREVPNNVVTMNSRVRLKSRRDSEMTVSLVFPAHAETDKDPETRKVSILTPVGLAILGQRVGHTVANRIRIDGLVYQPEAVGDFDV